MGADVNEAESLALFARGREAWNDWAAATTARYRALVAAGRWSYTTENQYPGEVIPGNPETAAWMSESIANFRLHAFSDTPDFSGFAFPGAALFVSTKFIGGAGFSGAHF